MIPPLLNDLTAKGIIKLTGEYKQKFDVRIEEANLVAKSDIMNEIQRALNLLDKQIKLLIKEVEDLKKQLKQDLKKLKEKKAELQRRLEAKRYINAAATIGGTILSFFPIFGSAISEGIQASALIAVKVIDEYPIADTPKPLTIPAGINTVYVQTMEKTKLEYSNQIDSILNGANHFPSLAQMQIDLKLVKVKLLTLEGIIQLETLPITKEKSIEICENAGKKQGKNSQPFYYAKTAILGLNTLFDVVGAMTEQNPEIHQLYDQIQENKKQTEKLEHFEKTIRNDVTPVMKSMRESIIKLENGMSMQNAVSLIMTDWKITQIIKNIHEQMAGITEGFKSQEEFSYLFNQLSQALTTTSQLYKIIDESQDNINFAQSITNLKCPTCMREETDNLGKMLAELDKRTRESIINSEVENVVASFKQIIFPFAVDNMDNLDIIIKLGADLNLEKMLESTTKGLNSVMNFLHGSETHAREFVTEYLIKKLHDEMDPFYEWKLEDNKELIEKLLSGEAVRLNADILAGSKEIAVKFNDIRLFLKARNSSLQTSLNEDIKPFLFSLVHYGDSHLRCKDRFFEISNDYIDIRHSAVTGVNDAPQSSNNIYKKLKNSEPMLSPYAMWRFQLPCENTDKCNFATLAKYSGKIDLLLIGRGQYVSDKSNICDEELSSHYEEDTVTNERFKVQNEEREKRK